MTVNASTGSDWDELDPGKFSVPEDQVIEFIERASTCVFIRNRKDGHPVGAVVGHNVLDGNIYTITNTHRAAYKSVQRDPRVCTVFDIPEIGSVTVIGQGHLVDDPDTLNRFYAKHAEGHYLVTRWGLSTEEYLASAYTVNRRLVHILPEKIFSTDLSKLPDFKRV